MPNLRRESLFWKYGAYFGGLVCVLLLFSGGVGGYFAYRQSVDALEELQRAEASFAAREITNFIVRVEEALGATKTKFHARATPDMDELRLELAGLFRHQPSIADLHWIDADGRERLALSRVVRDVVDGRQDWSNDARFLGARSRSKRVAWVHFRQGSEPHLTLVAGGGSSGAVLIAEVDLRFVGEIISRVQASLAGVAYVIDENGRLIAHPDASLMLANQDLSKLPQVRRVIEPVSAGIPAGEAHDLRGLPVLASAVPIPRLGWTVFAERSLAEAYRPAYASLWRSIALVFVGVLAAIIASLALARRMVRPIRSIEAGAREIGKGNLDGRIDIQTGDELESLGVELNRAAGKLKTIYATQEAVIAERTRELARADDAKTRFLAAASHDLRQPIHALALFVGQLRAVPLPTEGSVLAQKIESSVEALTGLLEALLDLSKLDVGTITPQIEAFPLHALLSQLVANHTLTAEAKGLAISLVPTSLWVRSDPLLLERILLNLVTNAIRYTLEGRILIGCRRRGDDVDILIADTGVGIESSHLPHIFQEFYRAGPRHGGLTKGMGLGLAIVKRLALLLDHRVTVDSVPAKGTVVRLSVPRAAPDTRVAGATETLSRDLRGTRVLVVDDETPVRDAMQGLLGQWGCEVITAEGGDDALEKTRRCPPHVVLCDLNLANGESGLRVIDRLRGDYGSDFACAFVTGESVPAQLAELRARGYPVLFKPAKPGKLRAVVEHLVISGSMGR